MAAWIILRGATLFYISAPTLLHRERNTGASPPIEMTFHREEIV
jgi:hypothetical protein